MSIRHLETLIAVAESGTFVDAAESVHLTPAAVSQQMKGLEVELGISLFNRNKRTPRLNPMGHMLVPKAREIVLAYRNLIPSLTGEGAVHDEITIGAVPTTMTGLIPRAMKSLRAAYSGLHVRIVPGLSADLLPQVDRGFLDAAIISEPANVYGHLSWRAFAEEPLIVLASLEDPHDDPKALLEGSPFIRFSRRAWVGQLIDEWLRGQKLRISESMELDTLESISTMVLNNLGVAIVPKRCVPSPRPLPLKRVPLGPTAKPRRLGVLSRQDTSKFRLIDIIVAELTRLVELSGEVTVLRDPKRAEIDATEEDGH